MRLFGQDDEPSDLFWLFFPATVILTTGLLTTGLFWVFHLLDPEGVPLRTAVLPPIAFTVAMAVCTPPFLRVFAWLLEWSDGADWRLWPACAASCVLVFGVSGVVMSFIGFVDRWVWL